MHGSDKVIQKSAAVLDIAEQTGTARRVSNIAQTAPRHLYYSLAY